MARRSAIETHSDTLSKPGVEFSAAPASRDDTASARLPDTPDAHRLLLRAQMLRGDFAAALEAARHLAEQDGVSEPVELLLDIALEHGSIRLARTVLAETEAEITALQSAMLRARIAVSERDFPAAKAILVTAIEAEPDAPPLRTLLTEVMVAAGTAADARAVLSMLGLPPVNPPTPGADDAEDDVAEPGMRAV